MKILKGVRISINFTVLSKNDSEYIDCFLTGAGNNIGHFKWIEHRSNKLVGVYELNSTEFDMNYLNRIVHINFETKTIQSISDFIVIVN